MSDKELYYQGLYVELVEVVTKNLLHFTRNESETLKIINVGIKRALKTNKGSQNVKS